MPFVGGPYVQAACFCDMVIRDNTNALSLIRVIDTLTHVESGPSPPEKMPPLTHALTLVLMLKSGKARGPVNLRIIPELPSAETAPEFGQTVDFEGGERGQNIVLKLVFTFQKPGLYWFRVFLGDEELTAVPFRVKYSRTTVSSTPAPPPTESG